MNTSRFINWSLLFASCSCLLNCSHGNSAENELTASTQLAVTGSNTKTISYQYSVPTAQATQAIAVLGFSDVSLGDRSKITTPK